MSALCLNYVNSLLDQNIKMAAGVNAMLAMEANFYGGWRVREQHFRYFLCVNDAQTVWVLI